MSVEFSTARVLVTGGGGFLGRAVLRTLSERGRLSDRCSFQFLKSTFLIEQLVMLPSPRRRPMLSFI